MTIRSRALAVILACIAFKSSILTAQTAAPEITGYVKTSFASNMEDASAFDVTNARLKVAGSVSGKTRYVIFIDGVRDDVLLDAYVSHDILPFLTLTAGQFKTPYSTDNLLSSASLAFINRPYLKSIASPALRDKGVKLTLKHGNISADIAAMNGSGQNKDENNNNTSVAARVTGTIIPGVNLSANYYHGKNTPDDVADDFFDFGANGIIGNFEYSGEYSQKDHDDYGINSLFVWVAYDIETGSDVIPLLTPAVRAERSDLDMDTEDDILSRYTASLSANFGKKYTNRVMINYEISEFDAFDLDDFFGIEYIVKF